VYLSTLIFSSEKQEISKTSQTMFPQEYVHDIGIMLGKRQVYRQFEEINEAQSKAFAIDMSAYQLMNSKNK